MFQIIKQVLSINNDLQPVLDHSNLKSSRCVDNWMNKKIDIEDDPIRALRPALYICCGEIPAASRQYLASRGERERGERILVGRDFPFLVDTSVIT